MTRVGEFYETYGVDAVMLMQHAGLNQMGQEVRAGCPRKNLQQTLNGLTSAGLTVAVYEEVTKRTRIFVINSYCYTIVRNKGPWGRGHGEGTKGTILRVCWLPLGWVFF